MKIEPTTIIKIEKTIKKIINEDISIEEPSDEDLR
jgi:hypothetical protein